MKQRKVFGVGLSRTGTTTLTDAQRRLRYISIHFPHDETVPRHPFPHLNRGW